MRNTNPYSSILETGFLLMGDQEKMGLPLEIETWRSEHCQIAEVLILIRLLRLTALSGNTKCNSCIGARRAYLIRKSLIGSLRLIFSPYSRSFEGWTFSLWYRDKLIYR